MLTKSSSLKTTFSGVDFSKYSSKTSEFVSEFSSRANQPGKFLNWVNLPQEQMKRLDDIYSLASNLKSQTGVSRLSVMGIGGSKHTVENMLSLNGLNLNNDEIIRMEEEIREIKEIYKDNTDINPKGWRYRGD